MRYTQFTDDQVTHMLGTIGVPTIEDLFAPVPESIRLRQPIDVPRGLSEPELLDDLDGLARRNHHVGELTCFLGGGAYDHFIPSLVDALAMQSEFVTGYTPYQAEASQGTLQLFYEFQSMVCALTGMDVSNASLYEGASAAGEAMVMATTATKRNRVVVAGAVHPDTLSVLRTYALERGIAVVAVPAGKGLVDEDAVRAAMNEEVAALFMQSPNFYGCLERIDRLIPIAHDVGALAVVATDPIACGMLKPPGAFDADIVVADGQPLGIPLQYGGPYLGLLACKETFLRRIPGRVVGMTTDVNGKRAFCLSLQTREQHIKRERATSNVCTNQGLLAVRAAVYMSAMGRTGIAKAASLCFDKAHYAAQQIAGLDGFELAFAAPFFKEFVVRTDRGVSRVLSACRKWGILGGVPLARFDSALEDCFLVAVTERRTKSEIDAFVAALRGS